MRCLVWGVTLATLTWLTRGPDGKRTAALVLGARSFSVTAWTHHEAEGFTTFEIEPDAEQFSWDFFNGAVERAITQKGKPNG